MSGMGQAPQSAPIGQPPVPVLLTLLSSGKVTVGDGGDHDVAVLFLGAAKVATFAVAIVDGSGAGFPVAAVNPDDLAVISGVGYYQVWSSVDGSTAFRVSNRSGDDVTVHWKIFAI